ncbi:MAG TPA: tetratricopeptide repeat protein [Longimicrobiales bacterium]|nr:tetratricopeptide repeat protein [Longimicrobiales bacterium]
MMLPPLPARRLAAVLTVLGTAACATGLPDVGPADIPRLQQEVAASPEDTGLQVQLGMAQFEAGEYETARMTLQDAVEAGDETGAAFLYLGMANEELQDWTGARDAYTRYLSEGSSSEAMTEVRKRLTLIGRNLLRAQAQQALTQEAQIAGNADVTPQSVAVLPLEFNSDRVDLEPLVYALSDMMTTDFAVSNALVVLERAQIQALLDEMALTSSGYSEPATGARAGRMLRAEHVFQGVLTTLGQEELQTDADVLNVPNTSSAGEVSESATLELLFDMEKQIVIRTIREVLGVELTPAEEQAILENRMSNVLAFLAYGRGLREIDRGNYEAAQAEFALSMSLDPSSFASRDAAMSDLQDLVDASGTSTGDLMGMAGETGEFGIGVLAPPTAVTTQDLQLDETQTLTLTNVTEGVAPTPTGNTLDLGSTQTTTEISATRDPVQEAQGQETVSGTAQAQIRIVIQRPGGEP